MYKPIRLGKRGFFVAIIILAAIFIIIYGNNGYAANQTKGSDNKFKSEEDLIDQTRRSVVEHLNDNTIVRAKVKEVSEEKQETQPAVIEEKPKEEASIIKEEPQEAPAKAAQKQKHQKRKSPWTSEIIIPECILSGY